MRCGSKSPRRVASACAKQRMPLPLISARPPSALNRIICAAYPSADSPTIRPSAPMPRRRSHTRRASSARSVDRRVERDEEVVAEPVVLGERELGRRVGGRRGISHRASASRTAGNASATGSASMSIQRTRGSRRNHRSWRTASWRVPRDDRCDGGVERAASLQVLDQLLVAERLAGGPRDRPLEQRRDLGDESGVDHRHGPAARSAGPARRAANVGRAARRRWAGTRRVPARTS